MSFFDEAYYVKSKVAQLNSAGLKDANGNPYTAESVMQGIKNSGLSLAAR